MNAYRVFPPRGVTALHINDPVTLWSLDSLPQTGVVNAGEASNHCDFAAPPRGSLLERTFLAARVRRSGFRVR